ncbi:hypothetical protein AVEN_67806-1 [Araneus ventricosus]|uniref:Uncharacterized protein n=1 Tax=Araneus ventricosus TaxID=182803 RepID=A0A4Y2QM37_ARAVE|nr:hypothetical protein AVEN_94185-1 [Araneus ventricosus]GBN65732.1 hypothetical protein AVEN_78455-1 [Araneus ventricosus]GBN65733.1 hypothetical protein AVEN_86756-1 [Araneus ventricosus]GBN72662.1 hypothetical protein AVEN_67806-1 [Araneus ventricosus]
MQPGYGTPLFRNCICDKHHFLQDGVSQHIATSLQKLLHSAFDENRILSRSNPHALPLRYPKLTSCDFWLRGYRKSEVYKGQQATVAISNHTFRQFVSVIAREVWLNAVIIVISCLTAILLNMGGAQWRTGQVASLPDGKWAP